MMVLFQLAICCAPVVIDDGGDTGFCAPVWPRAESAAAAAAVSAADASVASTAEIISGGEARAEEGADTEPRLEWLFCGGGTAVGGCGPFLI